MSIRTRLTERLGIEHPILLAPMGSASGGALAAAVSTAGGLGLIGLGYGDRDWLDREFDAAGTARVGCGFITWSLARRLELLDRALARRPAAVMLSFGDPAPFVDPIKKAGAVLICQVQTVTQAVEALMAGADVIVAQGAEAGGHGSTRATLPLVPAVVDAVEARRSGVPVVAAGGIADGRGLAAALALGAEGVLVGTRFLASEESLASPEAKAHLLAAQGDATLRTRVFDMVRGLDWPPGYTGRALTNRLTEQWHGREDRLQETLGAEQVRYAEAAARRDVDTAVVFAGEAIDLIHDIRPAAEIVGDLIAAAERILRRLTAEPGHADCSGTSGAHPHR
jgi:nitronate monooxygenase